MSNLTELNDVRLVPVLELEPGTFATKQRDCTTMVSSEDWAQYWRDCIDDSGLTSITPVSFGAWHVTTDQFTDVQLTIVIDRIFSYRKEERTEDGARALPGGLVFRANGLERDIRPTCCSDLANFSDWQHATSIEGTDWEMLWIGHPWLSVRREAEKIIMSDPHESNDPAARWTVDESDLQLAVNAALAELMRFSEQINSVLPDLGFVGDNEKIARKLAGLEG